MKQDEIIEMARQAGLHIATDVNWMPIVGLEYAEKLIALARAAEREACAKLCDELVSDENTIEYANGAYRCAVHIRERRAA